jgi:phosphoribosyl-AMP cyclohydrolase / phosphoribosyl-ATP pyrophosphohydrolase
MSLNVDWEKMHGLIPAIVQHAGTGAVLMLGYMNAEALKVTQSSGRVTFWSRSKQRLWTKGEESGHFLTLKQLQIDCDGDALLILAEPHGAVCHLGSATCWGGAAPRARAEATAFLGELDELLAARLRDRPEQSYTVKLADQGIGRIAQKVGEEGVELALAAVSQGDAQVLGEAADLIYHTTLLLRAKGLSLAQVAEELSRRHQKSAGP